MLTPWQKPVLICCINSCCMQLSIDGRLKQQRISFYLFLSNNSMAQMMRQQPPLSSSPCAPSPKNISHHFDRLLVGCCVPPTSRSHRNPKPRRSLFFSMLKLPPKTTRKRPTHPILHSCVSYQTPTLPMTPSFSSCLCRPSNERRPSKTGALPISDNCRWRRRQLADNGGNGNVDSGLIDGWRWG